ncbi:MAG TPA: FAD-binding oxidoreductase [Ktedonobacterales bacterium]|nr:FAD-binding oxidoreductase [Ktedonobacterales bacterium]
MSYGALDGAAEVTRVDTDSQRTGIPSDRVVVIGGGASGALIAVRLAARGFHVTLVEKAAIGNGSSSRSNAGIRAQFGVEETALGMMYSEWWYTHIHELLQTPPDQRQPAIRQNGYLFLYEDPELAAPPWQPAIRTSAADVWQRALGYFAMHQRIGLPVELLEPAEVARRWPWIAPERLIGATWCPSDGFLHPHVIYGEGVRRARELGVEVLLHTEVTGATLRGGRIRNVETTRGIIEADWFVNATNAWAPRVSRCIGGMPLPIAPTKRYLYCLHVTRPVMSMETWDRLPMTIYGMGAGRGMLSRPDGPHLLLAWAHDAPPEPAFSDADQDRVEPAFSHERGVENYGYAALAQLEEFAPALANAGGLAATTCGYYGVTPDHNPLIGFDTQQANLVHAAGFSGHGIMHAPITAVLVEALLAGDARDGRVALPDPFAQRSIALATFHPARDFAHSARETQVL